MIAQARWLGNIESFQSRNAVALWNAQSQNGPSGLDRAAVYHTLPLPDTAAEEPTPQSRFADLGISKRITTQQANIAGRYTGSFESRCGCPLSSLDPAQPARSSIALIVRNHDSHRTIALPAG
jgi:hypothetical protein